MLARARSQVNNVFFLHLPEKACIKDAHFYI